MRLRRSSRFLAVAVTPIRKVSQQMGDISTSGSKSAFQVKINLKKKFYMKGRAVGIWRGMEIFCPLGHSSNDYNSHSGPSRARIQGLHVSLHYESWQPEYPFLSQVC